jgi:anti-sigma factor RsiW
MNQQHGTSFDPTLLSGYLDGELTQAEEQRVRIRLEDDPEARDLVAEMSRIREAARATRLVVPRDEEWSEKPLSPGSRWFRRVGWVLLVGWAVALAVLAAWGLSAGPEPWWQKALAVTIIAGPVLLFLSVLLDRLKVMKHDRYRRVEK